MRFRIFGNGAFGTALGKVFEKNMLLEDSLLDEFSLIEAGDIMIPAVPSDVCQMVIKKLLYFGKPDAILLVSKGLSSNEILTNELKKAGIDIPLLYFAGPNLAKEIINDGVDLLSATLAGPKEITNKITNFVDNIHWDETEDLILPQIAAVIKNVTAFVIGYLNPNQNARATLIMQGMKDAMNLAQKLGSKETDALRGCFGDFVLTCTSTDSRNYQAGVAFASKGDSGSANTTQESMKSIENIYSIKEGMKLPIVDFFYNLVKNGECDLTILK